MSEPRLIDHIHSPSDLRRMAREKLSQVSDELRSETIAAVSETGGHLGAGLGVIELTVALHYVFSTPEDKLIWDVGHQAYPHKILTARRDRIRTIRQGGGLSGFTRRSESPYDPFGAAHSSTSISAGLGMAVARDIKGGANKVICVIGDGAISAGMAYEAMNNAGHLKSNLIVILNDNDMSIAPPTGAMSRYLTRLVSSKSYRGVRNVTKKMLHYLPSSFENLAKRAEKNTRAAFVGGGNIFEELGFYYIGPVDGHNLDHLVPILENVRDAQDMGPVLIHVRTEKGRGFAPAREAADKCHAVTKFCLETGEQKKSAGTLPTYSTVFARALVNEMRKDTSLCAITAAMPGGTGLDLVQKEFPDRVYDVGIAEQHAVTFAAGLSCEGIKPFVAIYSTFLQRAYDQVVHDVAIQNLPVRFVLDRAGLVGADGATHAGSFDLAYLGCLPNFVIMAPSDEAELMTMIHTMANYDNGPTALRFPRGSGTGAVLPDNPVKLDIGKGRILQEGSDIAILSLGTRLQESMRAAEMLAQRGYSVFLADMRFAKPVDQEIIKKAALCRVMISIEEGSIGGFAAQVQKVLAEEGVFTPLIPLTLPDIFQDHDTPENQYKEAGLMAEDIIKKALGVLERSNEFDLEDVSSVRV